MSDAGTVLPGEGDQKIVTYKHSRIRCDECGDVAHFKHSYLLEGTRRNPRSSAFGKDDCSWCEDTHRYTCKDCKRPIADGYEWCSTFEAGERFKHLFLRWVEISKTEIPFIADAEQQIESGA